jgi:hypothetical protein
MTLKMNIESPKVIVEKSSEYLFNALSEVKNYEKLMPDNIAKFEVLGEDIFNFGLAGMPEIKLKLKRMKWYKKFNFWFKFLGDRKLYSRKA